MPDTTFPASTGTLRAYLATPSTAAPWPGVVVIHEAFGMVDDIRRTTDRLAEHGYLAFAPDLYSYGFAPQCLLATFRTLLTGRGGRALADIDAAQRFVRAHEGCSGRVGVIGFCMGGGFALLAATRGFDASAANYGQLPRHARDALRGACPIVGSYGAKDPSLKGAARRLEGALAANDVEHDVKEYPNAGHGFMIEHTGKWGLVERVPGFGLVDDACDDAWRRVFTFFDRHLADTAGP